MKEEYLKWPWGISDTIENLKEVKKNLQCIMLNVNADGMGKQDSQEIGYDFDRAIKALEESRWIPIIEKLPEPEGYVLVSFENATLPDIARYEVDKDGNGTFYPGDDDASYISYGLLVNAWRPLPKPYREENEDEATN